MKYERLTQRDIIQKDDEYWTNWGTWEQIEPEHVGKRKGSILGWHTKMRRPIDDMEYVNIFSFMD